MAQPINTLPIITEGQISDNDSFVVNDDGDAHSSKRLLFSSLFKAIVSLTNNNTDSAQPEVVKVWTGDRTTYDGLVPDADVLYFTTEGGIFLGPNAIVDTTLLKVYNHASSTAAADLGNYTVRVVNAGEIPPSPDANTIYFERIP